MCVLATRKHSYRKRSDKFKAYAIATIKRNLTWLKNYLLLNPCVDCGEADLVVLDFDHIKGVKINTVKRYARSGVTISKLQEEVAKCEVRCANCHRRITAKRAGWVQYPGPLP